jgi:hypothetical protein
MRSLFLFLAVLLGLLWVMGSLVAPTRVRVLSGGEGASPSIGPARVVVSLTTSPTRIAHIGPLLSTLSAQTVVPDRIVLNLPRVFRRTGATFGSVPSFATDNPLVLVNWVDDVGPATKLVPTLALVEPDTPIITVDDDIEYKSTLVESMLAVSATYPDAAITGQSFRSDGLYADLVEGYSSVLYKKRFFADDSLTGLDHLPMACFLADDLMISNALAQRGVPIVRAAALGVVPFGNIYLDYGEKADALKHGADGHSEGNLDNYAKCARFLAEKGTLSMAPFSDTQAPA